MGGFNTRRFGMDTETVPNNNQSREAAELAVSTTYDALKTLRDNGELVPGTWYRITDYECTTSQADTMSAGHQFDIIVLALDESHLSEEAYAAHHGTAAAAEENNEQNEQNNQNVQPAEPGEEAVAGEGGRARSVDYFANNKLEAWKLKYCLDNDIDRFAWASNGEDTYWIEFQGKGGVERAIRTAVLENSWEYEVRKSKFYTSPNPGVGGTLFFDNELTEGSQWKIVDKGVIEQIEGKGVIFRMIDEFGNDCPYDFKNIMFKRFEITAVKDTQNNEISGHDLIGLWGLSTPKVSVDSETSEWFYTFSSVNDGTVSDASLNNNYDIVADSEGSGAGNNVMMSLGEGKAYLNNIVFINSEGNLVCYGNRFGMYCGNITLGDWCTDNTFGNGCQDNTFGNYCSRNTFGNDCGGNTFGNGCQDNTFGNSCYGNTFGNYCSRNTFGNDCGGNTFGNFFESNTFGNNGYNNTFGNNCGDNTFGNSCSGNTFGNSCSGNTFGNNCGDNTFGNNIQQFTVFEGVRYCDVTGDNNAANTRKNCQILNGTAGESNSLLTISFTPNISYAQVAGFNTSGILKIWNPADLDI